MRCDDLTREFILPLWKEREVKVIDAFVAPNAHIKTTLLAGVGPQALKLNAEEVFQALSDLSFSIRQVIQRDTQIIYQWEGSAIHIAPLLNVPPTDIRINFSGVILIKIENDLITEYYSFTNIPQVLAASQRAIFAKDPANNDYFDRNHLVSIIKSATGKRLTTREIECLSYWLKGFSIKSTAKILGNLSCRTVQTFRENIKKKLNVENFQELFCIIQESGVMPIFLDNITPVQPYVDIFEIQPKLLDVSDHT